MLYGLKNFVLFFVAKTVDQWRTLSGARSLIGLQDTKVLLDNPIY